MTSFFEIVYTVQYTGEIPNYLDQLNRSNATPERLIISDNKILVIVVKFFIIVKNVYFNSARSTNAIFEDTSRTNF